MFQHLSRLLRHSAVYGLAETVSRGTGFVLMLIYARLLPDEAIGVRSALYAASAFFVLFYSLGLDQAFLRYYMDTTLAARKRDVFMSAFVFTFAVGLVMPIPALFRGAGISAAVTGSVDWVYAIRLLFVIILFDTIVIYPMLVLRAQSRHGYYLLVSAERFVLFILLNLLMVGVWGRGVNGILEANLIVVGVVFVSLLPVIREHMGGQVSVELLGRMLAFGIPAILGIFAMRVIDLADRRLIIHFFDTAQAGLYSLAYTLGMVGIMVFVNSFRTAWQPFFLDIQKDPDARRVFSSVATYYSLFIGYAFLGMTVFREEIVMLAYPGKPLSIAALIPIVAVSYILYGFYVILLPGTFIREKTGVLTVASGAGAVTNVGLNLIFIPRYGITGAAWATVAAYVVMVSVLFAVSRRFYRVEYEIGRIAFIWVVTALAAVPSLVWRPESWTARIGYGAILCMAPAAVYLATGFFTAEERRYAATLFRRR